ncbi:polymer-forming cytoskeletal protein [Sphingomonas sp. MMS12-HWE2-04]|uniref:bactofilin family protein n=1 Tax=Sphingomonas sp. MMS12-HWE2-04 TaxID=3234199 RepID=UPI00384F3808
MFGTTRGGNTATATARASGRGMFSVIGPDMAITGNVSASADLHIDGRIDGDVACSLLVQGAGSQIVGNIAAETVRLAGSVEGSVRAKQLTVEATARIAGDVEYETITVEQGGQVDGRLKHLGDASLHAVPALPRLANEQAA